MHSIKSIHQLKYFLVFLLLLLIVGYNLMLAESFQTVRSYTVCIDAGHGGEDPGKVSASGIQEKDINLILALKCQHILEENGIQVIMTRTEDCSLSDPSSSSKKVSDLQKRKEMMNQSTVDCAVSIHLNSYPDSSQSGAQIFYPSSSEESKKLASLLQEQLRYVTLDENKRQIKANHDYYLLRDNAVPTVIAEVCFLSNPSEAAMITEEYIQDRAAFALAMGIQQYLNSL